jgi:DNA-binding transcriptional ArsR family regulator
MHRLQRPWSAEEVAELRRLYPGRKVGEVAQLMGRTAASVRNAALAYRVAPAKRRYTPGEIAYVKKLYGTVPSNEIAEKMGCSPYKVADIVRRKLGLAGSRPPLPESFDRQLKELHQRGLTDREMADAMSVGVGAVRRHRKKLGLSNNYSRDQWNRDLSAAIKRYSAEHPDERRRASVAGSETMRRKRRLLAERFGWPPGLPLRAYQLLDVLSRCGLPLTMQEVADQFGVTDDTFSQSRKALLDSGLITVVRRKRPMTYTLGSKAFAILEERAKWEEGK